MNLSDDGAKRLRAVKVLFCTEMASATVTPESPVDAIYRVWRAAQAAPALAHEAVEQVRARAVRNMTAAVESCFDKLKSAMQALQRVVWPLMSIQATAVYGLLCQTVTK